MREIIPPAGYLIASPEDVRGALQYAVSSLSKSVRNNLAPKDVQFGEATTKRRVAEAAVVEVIMEQLRRSGHVVITTVPTKPPVAPGPKAAPPISVQDVD